MDFLIANQNLIIPLIAAAFVWLVGLLTKKQIDKTAVISILTTILDIIQDISNDPATSVLANHEKKALALSRASLALPDKKKKLLTKVFGTLGGAIEYVYKNRKWLFAAGGKILKGAL